VYLSSSPIHFRDWMRSILKAAGLSFMVPTLTTSSKSVLRQTWPMDHVFVYCELLERRRAFRASIKPIVDRKPYLLCRYTRCIQSSQNKNFNIMNGNSKSRRSAGVVFTLYSEMAPTPVLADKITFSSCNGLMQQRRALRTSTRPIVDRKPHLLCRYTQCIHSSLKKIQHNEWELQVEEICDHWVLSKRLGLLVHWKGLEKPSWEPCDSIVAKWCRQTQFCLKGRPNLLSLGTKMKIWSKCITSIFSCSLKVMVG
jgi:hypothetical protein